MSRRLRERRVMVLTVVLLVLPPCFAAGAQAPARPADASVIVIDSAEIAASGARTLSELLMARVPGLSVRSSGGMEAEGAEVSARGMTAARGAAPMLVVDGILVDGNQAVAVPGTTATISRLDDFGPDDVQRIEVLRGPAASARYGFGGGAGVIAVTTRRGSAGALALDVRARVGLTDLRSDYPANYEITSGAPGQSCNPHYFTSTPVGCTPTTLYSWSPLEQASPFRVGRATAARVALSGTTLGAHTLAAVTAERAAGVTGDDWQSRLGLRAAVERELPGGLIVGAQGSYLERDASVPARGLSDLSPDNLVARGLQGSAYSDSASGYAQSYPALTASSPPEPSLVRVTSALRIDWRPVNWLAVNAWGGQDRARSTALRTGQEASSTWTVDYAAATAARWTSGTMHVGVDAGFGAGTPLTSSTYLAYDDVRSRDVRVDSASRVVTGGANAYSWTQQQQMLRSQEATVRQHVGWRDALDVNAVTRWAVGRGVSAPLGVESSRSLDAALRLPTLREGLDLRLRGAAGRVPLVPAGTTAMWPGTPPTGVVNGYPYGSYVASPLLSRRSELEGGLDANVGRWAQFQLTWFHARSTDVMIGATGPYQPVTRFVGVSDRGVEMLASAQLLDGPRLGWHTTVTVATLHSRVTDANGGGFPDDPYQVGYPPQGIWKRDYTWSDANGDGNIGYGEVTPGNSWSYVGPSTPTIEVGFRNTLSLPGALTLSALLDYRGGQYRENLTEQVRCETSVCLGINEPSLSLEEQARWVAVARGITENVEPASYLRLREMVLEWSPPVTTVRLVGARRLTVRLVGQNLATWTRYSGIDPEVGTVQAGFTNSVTDLFQGPLPRRVSLELRVGAGGTAM